MGDMLDPATPARAAAGVGAVFHLAGRLFVPGAPASDYHRLHVDATIGLIEAAARNALEYSVLCTTTGVHGPTRPGVPAREDDEGHPSNAYEESKARAEEASARAASRVRAPLVIARPGLVYGPGDRHLLGWYRAIQSGLYRVIGSGANKVHPIYVDDVVRGLLLAARWSGPVRAYHLVGSEAVTVREMSEAIGAAVGRPVSRMHLPVSVAHAAGVLFEALPVARTRLPLTRSRVRFMTENREYEGSRARDELGFVPEVNLGDGLARTVAWYRSQNLL